MIKIKKEDVTHIPSPKQKKKRPPHVENDSPTRNPLDTLYAYVYVLNIPLRSRQQLIQYISYTTVIFQKWMIIKPTNSTF